MTRSSAPTPCWWRGQTVIRSRALDFAVAMNPGDREAALRFLAALMGQLAQDLAGRRP
jgi:hypothetical protein